MNEKLVHVCLQSHGLMSIRESAVKFMGTVSFLHRPYIIIQYKTAAFSRPSAAIT